MTKKLSLFLVLVLSLVTFGLIGSNQPVQAHAQTTTVTLHKVLFGFGEMPRPVENSGEINEDYEDFEVAADVTFEIYDVSRAYNKLKSRGLTDVHIQKHLSKRGMENNPKLVTSGTTDTNGEVTFELETSRKGYKAYLFHESVRPEGVREKSPNFVLVLPFNNAAGEMLNHIHLYPKNEWLEHFDLEKEVVSEGLSYDVGERISYEIKTKVPVFPGDFETFIVKDTADLNLLFDKESLAVEIDGEVVDENDVYALEHTDSSFVLTFDLDRLKEFVDKEIVISYDMSLSEGSIPDVDYMNKASLEYDNNIIVDQTAVRTGGYRFIKVDRRDEKRTLAGAHFILKNQEGEYLVVKNGRYIWETTKENATTFISEADGSFEVGGLKYGQYYLEEIKAPQGYVLSTIPISFDVADQTYQPGAEKNIVNQPVQPGKLPVPGGEEEPETPVTPSTPEKPRLPMTRGEERPRLPRTGEVNNIILSIIGILLIGTALITISNQNGKRRKNK